MIDDIQEALRNGEVVIFQPFYKKVTLYLDCPHSPEILTNIYEYEILTNVYCGWCDNLITVEHIEKSEPIIFTNYINP